MAGPYTIQIPVPGQPISSSLYGIPVRDAVNDLHTRVALLEANTQRVVKRARRITAKTPITTESPYLRIDDIPVVAGGIYRITTSNLTLDSSVANEVGVARARAVQAAGTGTQATTSSTQIGQVRSFQSDQNNTDLVPLIAHYYPVTSGYLSVLLSAARITALGTFQFFASATEPCDMQVEFLGLDPGDSGVSL